MRFEELIDLKRWQIIQDVLANLTKMSLRTLDDTGRIVGKPSSMPEICSDLVSASPAAVKQCWQWFPQLAGRLKSIPAAAVRETVCPIGLVNFPLPVFNGSGQAGVYLIIGPVVLENYATGVCLSELVRHFGLNEAKFFACFNKLPAVNQAQMESVFSLVRAVTGFVDRLRLFHGSSSGELSRELVARILRSFLEAAMKVCDAEFGSIMLLEKGSQELLIKDAAGLSEEIINNTKLKPGEGLAGQSIQRRESLFLNEQLQDRELRLRMRRPKIKSAFVIPVFYHENVLGVVSVSTAKYPNRFSGKLMELLNEMVGAALETISPEEKPS